MPEWIRREQRVEHVRRYREFEYADEPGRGFGFPLDEELQPAAQQNLSACLTGVVDGQRVVDLGIRTDRWSHVEPGVIRCVCGEEVELTMVMTNTCSRCERDYNASGQLLAPREQWGWDTGESLGEILASDWPVDVSREVWLGEEVNQ